MRDVRHCQDGDAGGPVASNPREGSGAMSAKTTASYRNTPIMDHSGSSTRCRGRLTIWAVVSESADE